jgi:hypothetical protein
LSVWRGLRSDQRMWAELIQICTAMVRSPNIHPMVQISRRLF